MAETFTYLRPATKHRDGYDGYLYIHNFETGFQYLVLNKKVDSDVKKTVITINKIKNIDTTLDSDSQVLHPDDRIYMQAPGNTARFYGDLTYGCYVSTEYEWFVKLDSNPQAPFHQERCLDNLLKEGYKIYKA